MLLSSLKKMGCKHLMRIIHICKMGVSKSNNGRSIFIRLKVISQSAKTAKTKAKQWLNDALSRLNPKN
jgi:hypothetical protein